LIYTAILFSQHLPILLEKISSEKKVMLFIRAHVVIDLKIRIGAKFS